MLLRDLLAGGRSGVEDQGNRMNVGVSFQSMRPAKYTVDVGVQGMGEVFRRVFLRPMQWA